MSPDPTSGGSPARLLVRLSMFLDYVRSEGVGVGIGAGLDLGRSLEQLSVLNRNEVRDASCAALAKSPEEVRTVERAFDRFWTSGEDTGTDAAPSRESLMRRNPGPRSLGGDPRRARRRPVEIVRERELPIGVYSADAPSPGHPLESVSARKMARFRTASRRFRRECATLPGRRTTARSWGDLDLPATARRATRNAGEWVELAHRAPRLRRTDLVILWDVSGSMREHDTELFALVYALKRLIRSTRVFAFSTETVELTPYLAGVPYSRALQSIRYRLEAPGGGTQIAACLRDFRKTWGSSLRPTTTVLILSDGWDLGEAEGLSHELRQLRHLTHRLVWVNPYAARPGFAPTTAGMQAALPLIDVLTSAERFPTPHRVRAATARVPAERSAKGLSTGPSVP